MEQFDVNGLPSYSWLPAYAETEGMCSEYSCKIVCNFKIFVFSENNQNRSSRNILETILEETSDEESLQDVWPLYDENSCSSECESVIRVDILQGNTINRFSKIIFSNFFFFSIYRSRHNIGERLHLSRQTAKTRKFGFIPV
jgi:hypothetical protein